MNGRRHFLQLLACGLVAPVELFRGRSQVAVGELWTPNPLTYSAEEMFFEDDLQAGFDEILASTGFAPNTVWLHPAAFQKMIDAAPPFDAPWNQNGRDDEFLGYDRTKLYG